MVKIEPQHAAVLQAHGINWEGLDTAGVKRLVEAIWSAFWAYTGAGPALTAAQAHALGQHGIDPRDHGLFGGGKFLKLIEALLAVLGPILTSGAGGQGPGGAASAGGQPSP